MSKSRRKQRAIDARSDRGLAGEGPSATAPARDGAPPVATADAYQNPLARLGWGMPNLTEAATYPITRLTKNYQLMNSLYRSHWLVRRVVDAVPEDMLKAGWEIQSQMEPAVLDRVRRAEHRLRLREDLLDALRWGRLYGGAAAILLVDGHDAILDRPLDLRDVYPGSFLGLLVVDRWSGVYPDSELVSDYRDPDRGLPAYYQFTDEATRKVLVRVHHSRVLRFIGRPLPNWERQAETYWGASEVEHVFDELRKRDNTSWNVANLVFTANLKVLQMGDLGQMLSSGSAAAQQNLYNTIQAQNTLLNNNSMLVMDKGDTFGTHQYSFGGLSEVYQLFMLDVAGAAEIPVTRLFGRSPAGLNSTGESDLQNYYDSIAQKQSAYLAPALERLLAVLFTSELGAIPDDYQVTFPSPRTVTDEQKGQHASGVTGTVISAYNAGLIGRRTALRELQQLSGATGVWSNITDEEVETAGDEPGPGGEGEMPPWIQTGPSPGDPSTPTAEPLAGNEGTPPRAGPPER